VKGADREVGDTVETVTLVNLETVYTDRFSSNFLRLYGFVWLYGCEVLGLRPVRDSEKVRKLQRAHPADLRTLASPMHLISSKS
jgi:hypothetical protein